MILSYHPYVVADSNLRCAGRQPDAADAAAMAAADAVILNQGCYESLYRMAREHCTLVFPNYDARFGFPGKIGQIRLFQYHGAMHPPTETFDRLSAYQPRASTGRSYPAVFKFDWEAKVKRFSFWKATPAWRSACPVHRRSRVRDSTDFWFKTTCPTATAPSESLSSTNS